VGCHQKGGTWHHSFFKRISFGVNYNKTLALIAKFDTFQPKLQFRGIPPQKMIGYCDVDWAMTLRIGNPP
jgi:hypothetical protein